MEETFSFELRPPASPDMPMPRHAASPWLIASAVLLLVALVAFLIFWLRRKPSHDPLASRREALRVADHALANASPADVREAATLSSLVLRRYLATVADDPALFETHEEFVARRESLARFAESARAAAAEGFARLANLKYDRAASAGDPAVVLDDARALLTTFDRALRA
jgi:hypothetical protein